MQLWITACDEKRAVIFNQAIDFDSVCDGLAYAKKIVPAKHHGNICITDMDNNPMYPNAAD